MQRHALVSLILSGLLLYGGLFPLQGWHAGNAIGFLTERNPVPSGLDDLMVNVLVFVPLGFASLLALNRRYRIARSALLALLHGFVLSFAIESFQAFLPLRYSSLADLVMNTLGTALGAGAALWYRTHGQRLEDTAAGHWFGDARARLVLVAYAAWALAPLLPLNPVTDLETLHERLGLLRRVTDPAHPWSLSATLLGALWVYALARLWQAVSLPAERLYLTLLLPVLARLLIGEQGLRADELVGALLGVCLTWALPLMPVRRSAGWAGAVLLACFVISEALPGMGTAYRTFNWIPFKAHLQNPVLGIEALLDGAGMAVGLSASLTLLAPGARWRLAVSATLALALAAFALEWYQLRLPGRTPDITLPIVLALSCLLAFASTGVLRARQRRA